MRAIYTNRVLTCLFILITLVVASESIKCPRNCKCSWVLDSLGVDCSRQGLTEYPNFEELPIDNLDLSGNRFVEFPQQLADIESLTHLDLSNNKISYIDEFALLDFNALRTLNLANNSFNGWTDLNPSVAFMKAISLKRLILSGNQLHTFRNMNNKEMLKSESIIELELERCGITAVGGNQLDNNLPNLERLVLSSNKLDTVNELPSSTLRVLELSNCNLQRINPRLLQSLPNLEVLNVSWNGALQFSDFVEMQLLQKLDISFCNLDQVNLGGMPNLAVLVLRGNMLRVLDATILANNTQLERIDLARNALRVIQGDTFTKLTRLTTLDLSYNEIARLDRNLFRANDALVSLNLNHNVIEKFTKLVSNSLRDISLSWCEIIMIDVTALTGLSAIQRIDLSNTLIRDFPSGMHSETLKQLDLSNCRLTTIRNNTFSGFPELASLRLNGNRFTTPIPTEYFRANKYLDAIWLSDNPWICNCHAVGFMDFYDYLTTKPAKLKDRGYVRCASPPYLYGKTWEAACASVWAPNGRSSSNGETVWTTIMISIFALGVLACMYTCFKRFIKSRKREQDREEYRQNRAEMLAIRMQNQRMLDEVGTPNAPSPLETNLPSYEDALLMPKPDRPIKSMVDLTDAARSRKKLRRSRTNPEEDEDDELLVDNHQRFRSEEMLSNRDKERTAQIDPFRRTGYVEYNSSTRRFSIEDSRFPAAHLKSQNLQSAEQIGNFQSYENSPYSKRKSRIAQIPPFKRATMQADSVEFLTDPEYEASSKPGSPFARRKPKSPATPNSAKPLAPAVEDHFGTQQKSHGSSLESNDFQMVIEPEVASLPDRNNTSSSSEAETTNMERGRRKKRKNSTSRRASGNFNAAAAAAGESSSSDRDPIVVVHKPMRETLF